MSITAFKPTGAGMVAAINVFRATFSAALSGIPLLTAYDNYLANSNANGIFNGTTGYPYPMVAGVGGSAPVSADWFPSGATTGITVAGTANRLKGTTHGAALSTSAPGAGGSTPFNLGYRLPYDISLSAVMSHIIVVEYQYTGSTPTVTFAANAGTEGTPSWTTLDSLAGGTSPAPGTITQISFCDAGKGADGDATYRMGRPASFTAYPGEIWVRNY